MKKCIVLLTAFLLALTGCGCKKAAPAPTTQPAVTTAPATAPTETEPGPKTRDRMKLFILLPESWQAAGEDLQMMLQNLTYQVELQFAKNDAREQARQLTEAIEQDADGIILAPVDSTALTEVCEEVKNRGIPLFSYDRLLMNTEAVSYYVSFDYRAIGVALGQCIANRENLEEATADTPRTIEFFMGPPEDNSALLLYEGVMEVLQPYLATGALVALSGRTAFEDTCVVDWDGEFVAQRLEDQLDTYYEKGAYPDVICTVSDDFATVCAQVLMDRGITDLPVITGLGGTDTGIMNMEEGKQSITIETDLLELNDRLVQTVDAVMTGKEPELNTPEGCHNNAKDVPAYLCGYTQHIIDLGQEEEIE